MAPKKTSKITKTELEQELAAKENKLKDMGKQLAKALAAADKAEKKQKEYTASSAKFKAKAALLRVAESDDDPR